MPSKQHDQLVAILETASNEPIGIVLMTNDATKARAALYRARMAENNPAYSDLQFRIWPYEDGDLVVCHGQRAKPPNNLGDIDLGGILDLDLE
jgi:hypothetical protein